MQHCFYHFKIFVFIEKATETFKVAPHFIILLRNMLNEENKKIEDKVFRVNHAKNMSKALEKVILKRS